jgi:hypothetical protein
MRKYTVKMCHLLPTILHLSLHLQLFLSCHPPARGPPGETRYTLSIFESSDSAKNFHTPMKKVRKNSYI